MHRILLVLVLILSTVQLLDHNTLSAKLALEVRSTVHISLVGLLMWRGGGGRSGRALLSEFMPS